MQKTKTKTNAPLVGLAELTLFADPKTKKLGKVYRVFTGKTEEDITFNVKYYSMKYGILEAKTISKEEYESAIKNNR